MKRDRYDALISDLVRLRANFTCEKCGIIDPNGQQTYKSSQMQCSHFNGRGSGLVARYDIDNCRCLCASCHSYLENKPGEHTAFLRQLLGERRFELLEERCRKVKKMYKSDKQEMYVHYQAEYSRLVGERKNGNMGYIELVNYF